MSGTIFLLQEDSKLVRMDEAAYDSEDLLQQLLATHPDLLAGDQIDRDEPRRWVLVSREMAVPGEQDAGGRWSLDHLFLDQDAIPTLVEVKRSCDTRLRRELIGQMLDYAANAVVYWPVEAIRRQFERTAGELKLDPTKSLTELIGPEGDLESFWQTVKTNLQAGRIRLVLIADEIPEELRRVVEFLNGQMDPAEVLAIEVKQYTGQGGLKTLVPRVIGQTAVAQQKKSGASKKDQGRDIDEAGYLAVMSDSLSADECMVARSMIQWAKKLELLPNFVKWPKSTSYIPIVEVNGENRYPVSVQSGGKIYVQMRWLRESHPFRIEEKRNELFRRLNEIPAVSIPKERMTGYPGIALQSLTNKKTLRAFLDTMTWVVAELRRSPPAR